jgi:hypothetical protein
MTTYKVYSLITYITIVPCNRHITEYYTVRLKPGHLKYCHFLVIVF